MPPSATVTTTTTPAIGQETHWTRNTLDGFGRAIKAESGHGSTTVSVVDTVYGPCGCSPMGKMMKVSMPHAPNATAVWTVYTYDALGRTLSVTAPDGSAKTYRYTANTVTATDEAGKWKTYAMDAFGNLATVVEPNPAGGTFSTTYAYDFLNHLTTVTMPRPTGTQTRTFNYGNPPGARLMSATNPETGTVTYTYNADGTVATKTDAKGQQVQYSYDTYGRMNQVRHYIVNAFQQLQEDTCQQVNLTYDSNSAGGYYLAGRLATRSYKTCTDPNLGTGGALTTSFTEMFSYHQAGAVTTKRLHLERQVPRGAPYYDQVTAAQDLDGTWTYDKEGKMTAVTYPTANGVPGASYSFGFDSMQRPNTMTDVQNGNAQIVTGVQYGPAGELLSISGQYTETRSYNSRLQLTSLNGTTFNYPTNGTNNGKISSEAVSGETISYQYDSLNRLISASSNLNWGQGFVYDGFGNLTQKTVLAGSVPTFSTGIDPATNRLVGWTYDANGNQITTGTARLTYDVENRITWSTTGAGYGYDPDNRRVYRSSWTSSAGTWTSASEEITYYGISSQRMASYSLTATADSSGGHMKLVTANLNVYFGSRLIGKSASNDGSARTTVTQDKVGSVGKYYPYGEDRGSSNPPNGTDKFAAYLRDDTGLDYAVNRYYNSVSARFMSADQYLASAGPGDPASWNRYGYVGGDPVDFNDPQGNFSCAVTASSPAGNLTSVTISCETAYKDVPWFQANGFATSTRSALLGTVTIPQALQMANNFAVTWEAAGFSLYSQDMARAGVNSISKPCQDKLTEVGKINLYDGPDSVLGKVSGTWFYDDQQSYVDLLPIAYFGYDDGGTVGDYFSKNPLADAFVSREGERGAGNLVVLKPGTGSWLVSNLYAHEMLHVATGQNDLDLATRLGYQLGDSLNPSEWISRQLDHDCKGMQ